MAVKTFAYDAVQHDAPAARQGRWENLTTGDVGEKLRAGRYPDKTVHAIGDFTGGGTIALRGSCMEDPNPETAANWFPLTDPQGTAITLGDDEGKAIHEAVTWVSPSVTGTVADADLNIHLGTR